MDDAADRVGWRGSEIGDTEEVEEFGGEEFEEGADHSGHLRKVKREMRVEWVDGMRGGSRGGLRARWRFSCEMKGNRNGMDDGNVDAWVCIDVDFVCRTSK